MATRGTPNEGRDLMAARIYVNCTMVLYVNAADSLTESSVAADLVQPTGTGYVPISLNGVFASLNGVVQYDHGTPDEVVWQNTHASNNWSQDITGAAILSGGKILHFHDAATPVTMTPGQKIAVDVQSLIAP
jgi:hypothetical protein